MQLSKNKKSINIYFFLFYLFLLFFNGGNSNLFIQLNFILISLFFLYCLKDKKLQSSFKKTFILITKNQFYFSTLIIFLSYLIFQILTFTNKFFKIFSPF